jgi:hypothetical protein
MEHISRRNLVGSLLKRTAELHPGYSFGSRGTTEEQAEFGRKVIEYIQESVHGGWEGFRDDFRGMSNIYRLLADLELFIRSSEAEDRCPQCGVGPEGPDLAGNQGHIFTCPLHPENLAPAGNIINTAQEAIEYLIESYDVPQTLRAETKAEIGAVFRSKVG